jgi:hypothetical protein
MVWAVSLLTTDLSTRSLTPKHQVTGIRSLTRFGNLIRPLAQSVLYLLYSCLEASPKAISGRTSYLRVRLAFHPYPQLITQLFNAGVFEPPRSLTSASLWPWVDHPVSGLHHATGTGFACPYALFRLAFASAPSLRLNLAA